jgi:hypothetical protein
VVLHALVGLLACLPAPAQACTPQDSQPLDAALTQVPACQANAGWLAWLGERLNRAGRHAEALEHLERALLLEPAFVPAQLGYLLALAGSGDLEAALAYAGQLLDGGALPPELAQPLAARVARWQQALLAPPPAASSRTRYSVGLRAGHDSNLLGAPNLNSLTLILAGQPVDLPLDDSYRRRPGNYLRLDLAVDHTRLLDDLAPGLRIDVGALARHRASAQVPLSDLGQGQVVVEVSQTRPRVGWYASASAAVLEAATGTRYRTLGAGGGAQWRLPGACEARTGLETQQRTLASNPLLSGRYAGVLALLHCEIPGVLPQAAPGAPAAPPAWQALAIHGTDRPDDPERPGGAQRQSLLRLTGLWGPWLMELDAERRRDAAVHSALLGDERRDVSRRAARIEWRRMVRAPWDAGPAPAGAGLELRLGVEWSRQRANLELFGAQSWGPYVALRHVW